MPGRWGVGCHAIKGSGHTQLCVRGSSAAASVSPTVAGSAKCLSMLVRTRVTHCMSVAVWMVMLRRTGLPGKAVSFSRKRKCQLRACCVHSEPEFILLRHISQRSLENSQFSRIKKEVLFYKSIIKGHMF